MKKNICLFKIFSFIFLFGILSSIGFAQTQEQAKDQTPVPASTLASTQTPTPVLTSQDYVKKAWVASSQNDLEEIQRLLYECLITYGEASSKQQGSLTKFPPRGSEFEYQEMDDIATVMFIRAEAVMKKGETEKAKELFRNLAKDFPWAQVWDPRGWYWSVAEKSQASIDKLEGRYEATQQMKPDRGEKTKPVLIVPGTEKVVDYNKYGHFTGIGTKDYKYIIDDREGLKKAVGEGIYPDATTILNDPSYQKLLKDGSLGGSHWNYVETDDLERAFCKWNTAASPWGERLFYIGSTFEQAGMFYEAIKAFRAIQIHFPSSMARTYWNTPWYPGQAAIAKIRHILDMHPELNLKYTGAKIKIINGFDNTVANDITITWPGELKQKTWQDHVQEYFARNFSKYFKYKITDAKQKVGGRHVQLVQSKKNGHWQLLVDGKPFMIRGLSYDPTKVGETPDNNSLSSWQTQDTNHNGLADGPFDSWVDKNWNNIQDPDEPAIGDFKLMKDMGANAIRLYEKPADLPNRALLRKMYKDYGIMVIMGNFLGKYAIGSGAKWAEGTDYENPQHKKAMMESVRSMVEAYKNEPFVLFWLLGNENNYGVGCNADKKPEAYYKFVEEVIKSIDPNHPVAVCNGDVYYLDIFAKNCPSVDILGANTYRGDYGFGAFWEQVYETTGKPAFITEYGCPAYANFLTREEAEQAQANYHRGAWEDIMFNSAGTRDGVGNALGGLAFEWMDEWWKNYEPSFHDKTAGAKGPFPDGFMYEEWFGLAGQGNGQHSPFLRQLRKSYYYYKGAWN
ncbi:MAG: hypothetical protein NT079_01440 [Candidatus Omnitrophica bacterium]|nr:hypothetical protein [Candidatus Omnitrophota bacterium]